MAFVTSGAHQKRKRCGRFILVDISRYYRFKAADRRGCPERAKQICPFGPFGYQKPISASTTIFVTFTGNQSGQYFQ